MELRGAFIQQKDGTYSGRHRPLILDRSVKVKKVTWMLDRSRFEPALKYRKFAFHNHMYIKIIKYSLSKIHCKLIYIYIYMGMQVNGYGYKFFVHPRKIYRIEN